MPDQKYFAGSRCPQSDCPAAFQGKHEENDQVSIGSSTSSDASTPIALDRRQSGHAGSKIFYWKPMSAIPLPCRLSAQTRGNSEDDARIGLMRLPLYANIPGNWPMTTSLFRSLWSDARHLQIVALVSLLAINFATVDFGAHFMASACAVAASLATQVVCGRLAKTPLDLRSPLITGLSLCLLLRADGPWVHALAGVIAISSKFLLRVDGKHVFNPAGFAIVAMLLLPAGVWISPGQWGASLWFAVLVSCFAITVLHKARRADIAIYFLLSYTALLIARASWLGDSLAIPLHQLQSGSLLIFTFFMISDPRTSPDSALGRFLFAFAVAGVAHYLAFFVQMRPALYFALIALSPATLVIDRTLPAPRFSWSTLGASQ
jgi:enediyne biosynthesis protein E5